MKSADTRTRTLHEAKTPVVVAEAFRNKSLLLGESERNALVAAEPCIQYHAVSVRRVKERLPPAILENVTRMFSVFPFGLLALTRRIVILTASAIVHPH